MNGIRFWPRTLVVQLIVVTAAAVIVSNLVVAYWFEHNNQMQNETTLTDRVLDRATTVLTTLRAIPPDSRPVVMKTLSSHLWQLTEIPRPQRRLPMDEEETRLAQRLAAVLPLKAQKAPITVHLHEKPSDIPDAQLPVGGDRGPVTGFVLNFKGEEKNGIYITGDTVWYEGVEEVGKKFDIGLILLFIGAARLAAIGPANITMTVGESIKAARLFDHADIIPLHFEGWEHFTEGREEIIRQYTAAGLLDRIKWAPPYGPQ